MCVLTQAAIGGILAALEDCAEDRRLDLWPRRD